MAEETKNNTPLETIYNGLANKNPQLKERGFDAFKTDMQDDNNLQQVYNGLTVKNPMLKERGFDTFKTDMFGGIQTQDNSQQPTPEAQPKDSDMSFGKKLGGTVGNSFMTGLNSLNSWIADAPALIYDLAGAPFRAVGMNVPKSEDFKGGALENVSEYYQKNAKAYEEKVKKYNPEREKGIVGAFQNGDIEAGVLNLAGGVSESLPASMAMMMSGGMTTPTLLGSAAVFGAGKVQELDENAPDMDYDKRRLVGAINGTLEGVFETYLGSGAVGKSLANIIKREGADVATKQVERSLKTVFADMITKNPWVAPLGEGFEEVGTQIAQNIVDKYSGYTPDIDIMSGVGDAFLSGVTMGGMHGAVVGLAKQATKQKGLPLPPEVDQEEQPVDPEGQNLTVGTFEQTEQPAEPLSPQEEYTQEKQQWETEANQMADMLSHENGSIVFVRDYAGNDHFVKGGDLNSDTKQVFTVQQDEEGNVTDKKPLPVNDIDKETIETLSREDFLRKRMMMFEDIVEQSRYPQVGETVEYAAKEGEEPQEYSVIGDQDGNLILTQDGENAIPVPKEQFAAPHPMDVAQEEQEQAEQSPAEQQPEVKPVITEQIGKNTYDFVENEDGSLDLQLQEKQDAAKTLATLEKEFKDNPNWEVVAEKEIVEIPAPNRFTEPTQQTVVSNIKVRPKAQAEQVNPELQQELKQETEPSYTLANQPIDREQAKVLIEMAGLMKKPGKIKELVVNNDEELSGLMQKYFPKEEPKYAFGKTKLDAQKARMAVEMAETPKELAKIRVSGDEELSRMIEQKTKFFSERARLKEPGTAVEIPSLTPDQAEQRVNSLLDEVNEYNDIPNSHVQKRSDLGQRILKRANEVGHKIATNDQGRMTLIGTDNKPVVRKIAQRTDKSEIEQHNGLNDYSPEFIEIANNILSDGEVNLQGVSLNGLTPSQVESAIKNIQEGKKTVAANTLLDAMEQMHTSGEVVFKGGYGMVPFDKFMESLNFEELTDEEVEIAGQIPEDIADAIINHDETIDFNQLFNDYLIEDGNRETNQSDEDSETSEQVATDEETESEQPEQSEEEINESVQPEQVSVETETKPEDETPSPVSVTEQPTVNESLTVKSIQSDESNNDDPGAVEDVQGNDVQNGNDVRAEDERPVEELSTDGNVSEQRADDKPELKQETIKVWGGHEVPVFEYANVDDAYEATKNSEYKQVQALGEGGLINGLNSEAKKITNWDNVRVLRFKNYKGGTSYYLQEKQETSLEENGDKGSQSKIQSPLFDNLEKAEKRQSSKQKAQSEIKEAESKVNTNPTDAQKEAGNYAKGHVNVNGFDLSIETVKGEERKGQDENGNPWSVTMQNSYGYYKRTNGTEGKGEQVDVFLGPNPISDKFYVVDQVNPDGTFDEHKVMQGFNSIKQAEKAYMSNYSEGWQGFGAISELSKEEFAKWLKQNNPGTKAKRKPVSEMVSVKKVSQNDRSKAVNSRQNPKQDKVVAPVKLNEKELLIAIQKGRAEIAPLVKQMIAHLDSNQKKAALKNIDSILDRIEKLREQHKVADKEYKKAKDYINSQKNIQRDLFGFDTEPVEEMFTQLEIEVPKDFSGRNIKRALKPLKDQVLLAEQKYNSAITYAVDDIKQAITTAERQKTITFDSLPTVEQDPEIVAKVEAIAKRHDKIGNNSIADILRKKIEQSKEALTQEYVDFISSKLEEAEREHSIKQNGNAEPFEPKLISVQYLKDFMAKSRKTKVIEEYIPAEVTQPLVDAYNRAATYFAENGLKPAQGAIRYPVGSLAEKLDKLTNLGYLSRATGQNYKVQKGHKDASPEKLAETIGLINGEIKEINKLLDEHYSENPDPTPGKSKKAYGADNKIVSNDRYEELKKRMKDKLNNLNAGFDPEMFAIGAEMAAYHIEAGANKFADFANRMVADLGEAIQPYLKSYYKGSRNLPGMEGFATGMDSDSFVDAYDFNKETAPGETKESIIPKHLQSKYESIADDEFEADHPLAILDPTSKQWESALNEYIEEKKTNLPLFDKLNQSERRVAEKHNKGIDKNVPLNKEQDNENANYIRPGENGTSGRGTSEVSEEGIQGESEGLNESSNKQGERSGTDAEVLSGDNGTELNGNQGNSEQSNSTTGRTTNGNDGNGTDGRSGNNDRDVEPVRNSNNLVIEKGERLAPRGDKAKINANIKAIEIAKKLTQSGKQASKAQMEALKRYTGWGGLSSVFKLGHPQNQQLQEVLTPEEYKAARASTTTAFYTPPSIISNTWDMIEKLGFKGGNILEPSAGIGHFFGLMPRHLSERSNLTGVELDDTSGSILTHLYPDANITVDGYETVKIPNNSIDLVVTNVPFGDFKVYDSGEKDISKKFNIHDYFIAKSVRKLKPGGIGVFITSTGTMDTSKDLRSWLSTQGNADVIDAVRLNADTFKSEAGTEASSDIIIIQKRKSTSKSPYAKDVLDTAIERQANYTVQERSKNGWGMEDVEKTATMKYNKFFLDNPEKVAGVMKFGFEAGMEIRPTQQIVKADNSISQEEVLKNFVEQLPTDIYSDKKASVEYTGQSVTDVKEGGITVVDGKPMIVENGVKVPAPWNENKVAGRPKAVAVNDYIKVKTAIDELIDSELNDRSDMEQKRKELNRAYDTFVSRYGTLNNNVKVRFLADDVDFPGVAAIENVTENKTLKPDQKVKKADLYTVTKSDIFTKRILGSPVEAKAETVADAVKVSKVKKGGLDIPYMSELLDMDEQAIKESMLKDGSGFVNPITGLLETKDDYLSGNVVEKLKQAEAANEDGDYRKNVEELKAVIPARIPIHLISVTLGSTWVPDKVYNEFFGETFGVRAEIKKTKGDKYIGSIFGTNAAANESMGITEAKAHKIAMDAMNNKPTVIYDSVYDPSTRRSKQVKNVEATEQARVKQEEYSTMFQDWIRQGNSKHTDEMIDLYNETFNAIVQKEIRVDDFETFPGATKTKIPREHQKIAVLRNLEKATLDAHEVGTGKTITLISTAMEMRRLGLAKKPTIVVQRSTYNQFINEIKELYPNAKVLVPSAKDLKQAQRKQLFAKIAYNDWDIVVLYHSYLDAIPDDPARVADYIDEQIQEKLELLDELEESDDPRSGFMAAGLKRSIENLEADRDNNLEQANKKEKSIKQIEKTTQKAKTKAEQLLDRKTDDVMYFEQLGIDALLVDEAHGYKKLGFNTNLQGIKGIDTGASKKAQSMRLKTRYILDNNNGKNVVFATGTPISNTMAEAWTFMRYLLPKEELSRLQMNNFDAFVNNFGVIEESSEFSASGKFKITNRLSSYTNMPELKRAWKQISHTVLTEEIESLKAGVGTPHLKGGKPTDIFLKQGNALKGVMKGIKERIIEFDNMTGKEKKENSHIPLVMFGLAKRAAIDVRLIDHTMPDDPNSKLNKAVEVIIDRLDQTKEYKGAIAVFLDSYRNVKGKQEMFNAYDDMTQKLIDKGIPAEQIANINDYNTDDKKEKLFAKVNAGDIRVVFGSTEKLGVGVNIQERLYADIHLDAPTRPSDYQQRNGRLIRQGNLHLMMDMPVEIIRLGVERSLDVTGYQRLEIKGKQVKQMMTENENGDREMVMDDMDEVDPNNFSEMMANISGSKAAHAMSLEKRKLQKLENQKEYHRKDQIFTANKIQDNKTFIPYRKGEIKKAEEQKEAIKKHFPSDVIETVKFGKAEADKEFVTFLDKTLGKIVAKEVSNLKLSENLSSSLKTKIYLNGVEVPLRIDFQKTFSGENNKLRVMKSIYAAIPGNLEKPFGHGSFNSMIGDIASIIDSERYDYDIRLSKEAIERYEKENENLSKKLGKPFPKEAELEKAKAKVEELRIKMEEELAAIEAEESADNVEAVEISNDLIDEATDGEIVTTAPAKPKAESKPAQETSNKDNEEDQEVVEEKAEESISDSNKNQEQETASANKLHPVEEYTHTKTGETLYNVRLRTKPEPDFVSLNEIAKKHNPNSGRFPHSRYSKGFLFKDKQDAENFKNEVDSRFSENDSFVVRENEIAYGSQEEHKSAIRETVATVSELGRVRIADNQGGILFDGGTRERDSRSGILSKIIRRTILDGFRESGYVDFTGKKINSIQDIADLWAIHRSPKIEKFHAIFLNDGRIAGTTAFTLHMASTSKMPEVDYIASLYHKHGADQVYYLHNHPSGNHKVSPADILSTQRHFERLSQKGVTLTGHVVIDTTKFSYIDVKNNPYTGAGLNSELQSYADNYVEELEYKNAVAKLFSEREQLPDDYKHRLLEISKALLTENQYNGAVIYLSSNNQVTAYDPFPANATASNVVNLSRMGLNIQKLGAKAVVVHDGSFDFSKETFPNSVDTVIDTDTNVAFYPMIDSFLDIATRKLDQLWVDEPVKADYPILTDYLDAIEEHKAILRKTETKASDSLPKGSRIADNKDYFDPENSNVLGEITGERGASKLDKAEKATKRLDSLKVARDMEQANKDAKAIKLATGWERGADKKWRYEIPDVKLTVTKAGKYKLNKAVTGEALQAYPKIGKMTLEIIPRRANSTLEGYKIKNKIVVYANSISGAESTLVHEIQHAIQAIEGFEKGTNSKVSGDDAYWKSAGEVEARNVQTRLNMSTEERLNSLLSETEDISRQDQVFFNNILHEPSAGNSHPRRNMQAPTKSNLFESLRNDASATFRLNKKEGQLYEKIENTPRKLESHYNHTLIKRQIKALQQGHKLGVQDTKALTKAVQGRIIEYAKNNMPLELAGKREVTQLMNSIRNTTDVNKVVRVFYQIDDLTEGIEKKAIIKGITKLLKQHKPKSVNGRPVGTLDPDTYLVLDKIRNIVSLTKPDDIDAYVDSLTPVDEEGNATEENVEDIALFTMFGNMAEKSREELTQSLESLRELIAEGQLYYRDEITARSEYLSDLRNRVISKTSNKGVMSAQDYASYGIEQEYSKIKSFVNKNLSFEWLLDAISVDKSEKTGEGWMQQHFGDVVNKATNQETKGNRDNLELIDKKAEEIFGVRGRKLAKVLAENSKKVKNSGVTYRRADGKRFEIKMSQNQAYKKWMEWQDPTLDKTFKEMGWDETTYNQLENFIKPEVKKWAEWQLNEFYPEYYVGVNDAFRDAYFVNMPFNPKYSPIRREYSKVGDNDDTMLTTKGNILAGLGNGSLKTRQNNIRHLNLVDGDLTLAKHIAEMEHFKAWVRPMKELRSVFGSQSVQQVLKHEHGNGIRGILNKQINDFARGGVDRALVIDWLDRVRRNFVTAELGLNYGLLPKQLVSAFTYMMDMPLDVYMKGMTELITNPAKVKRELNESELIKNRYKSGWTHEVESAMKGGAPNAIAGVKSGMNELINKLMLPTKLGDKFAIYAGWTAYKYHLDEQLKKGVSQKEAKEYAMNQFERIVSRSQQSAALKDTSELQKGSMGKLFTMFHNSQQQYFRYEIQAIRNLAKGRGSAAHNMKIIAVTHFLLPMMFQLVSNWFTDDDEKTENKRLLRSAILGSFNGLLIAGDIIESGIEKLTGEYWNYEPSPVFGAVDKSLTGLYNIGKGIKDMDSEAFVKGADMLAHAANQTLIGLPYRPTKKIIKQIEGITDGVDNKLKNEYDATIKEARKYEGKLDEWFEDDPDRYDKEVESDKAERSSELLSMHRLILAAKRRKKSYEEDGLNDKAREEQIYINELMQEAINIK
nr:LPD23 domain-containing protein [uncultured Draconibacterium sp.]